jgi:hypothetical protein
MHRCEVVTEWSDGSQTKCKLMTDERKTECYHHAKYFEKALLADGELHWKHSPAYTDRLRESRNDMRTQSRYIIAVFSPRQDKMRKIGSEYDDR